MGRKRRISVLLSLLTSISNAQSPSDPDYYELLRVDKSLRDADGVGSTTSNLFQVSSSRFNATYRLAHLSSFFPFSNGTYIRAGVRDDGAAALLAIYHFNNIMESNSPLLQDYPVLQNCNVRLTTDLFDTHFAPVETTRLMTDILQTEHSLETPLPTAVVGAHHSASTSPLAILSGVYGIPQISYGSTSTIFDNKEQYPLFSRSCPSSVGEARASVDYLLFLGFTHVAVLFLTDPFGSAFQVSFQDYAAEVGITTYNVPFSYPADVLGDEISPVIDSLKETNVRTFFVICFEDHYPVIMSTAKAKGIVGDEYFWFFSPGISGNVLQVNAVYEPGSVLYEATRGVGLIQLEASLTTTQMRSNEDADTALPEVPENGHERFRVAWREAMEDIILVEYFRSKLPPSLESIDGFGRSEPFSKEPSVFGAFAYDAVTALGIAMCNVELDFISGPEIYDKLVNVAFDGASGKVVLNGKTGTRDYTTLSYMMWNFFPRHGMAGFELVPTNYYKNGEWQPIPNGKSFCYADGTSTPPENLPPIDENMNMIGSIARTISYILIGVIVFCSCCAILWVICCRNEPVVRASQPLFLYMVALGSLIMAVSIIPLSLEEPVSIEILNMACIAHFWIYLIGYLLAFTAFFAKARRIKQVFHNPVMDIVTICVKDTVVIFFCLFSMNAFILVIWTLVSPPEWTRTYTDATDLFDRSPESYGRCSSEYHVLFFGFILVINASILIVANWWSYQTRQIVTEYDESRYIGISMGSFLQAWGVGVPILLVLEENPQAKFFVLTAINFVTSTTVLLLIFIPKMYAVKTDRMRDQEENRRQMYLSFRGRTRQGELDPVKNEDEDMADTSNPGTPALHEIEMDKSEYPERTEVLDESDLIDSVGGAPAVAYAAAAEGSEGGHYRDEDKMNLEEAVDKLSTEA